MNERPESALMLDNIHETSPTSFSIEPLIAHEGEPQFPWRRYWAKLYDLCLGQFIGLIIVLLVRSIASHLGFYGIYYHLFHYSFLYQILFFLAYESFLISLIGSTPGKGLLGISVTTTNGEMLTYARSLLRSIYSMGSGIVFGVPPFSIIAMLYSWYRALRKRRMFWDVATQSIIKVGPLDPVFLVIYVCSFILLIVIWLTVYSYS